MEVKGLSKRSLQQPHLRRRYTREQSPLLRHFDVLVRRYPLQQELVEPGQGLAAVDGRSLEDDEDHVHMV